MSWEARKRGGRYYTRSKKVNGKVRREYVGGGLAGELAAKSDQERRAVSVAKGGTWHAERADTEEIERILERLIETSAIITSSTLLMAGYRQHNRGEGRRTRE